MGKINMPPDVDEIDAFKVKRARNDEPVAEGKLLSVTIVARDAKRANHIPSRNRLEDFDLVFTYQEKQ